MNSSSAHLYDLPLYYDIAFADNTDAEIAVLQQIFGDHAIAPPARLLEPACGTGRLAIPLARAGYRITGYDLNDAMLRFGRQRITDAGLVDHITLHHANMTDAVFEPPHDAAICMIGSMGHLHEDQDIIAHLRAIGQSLRPGGIYIAQLTCLYEADTVHEHLDWTVQRDGIAVHTFWEVEYEDTATGLSRQHYRMTITRPDSEPLTFEERFDLRIWTFDDWLMLLTATEMFELAAIYDETGQSLTWDTPVTGEDGNLLYVLRRV